MALSYNGWTAGSGWSIKGGQLAALVIAGEPFSPGVRAGDVHTVLNYVALQLHHRVEPVVRADWHQADDWGYSYRANTNNPSQLSCHASATAIDYNATRHPNGKSGTWTAAQKAEILKILAEVDGVVRCLFGYDEMHFEICAGAAAVARVAQKLRGGGPVVTSSRHPIVGAIRVAYDRQALRLGQAKGPEVPTWDKVGRWQEFDGGVIYWHPAVDRGTAHIVWGDILKTWRAVGSEPVTGYPVSDELPCPDGVGRMTHFSGGKHGATSIYWHPLTGAHPVWGAFREWWAANRYEKGALGYPTSGEYKNAKGMIVQDFQGGQLRLIQSGPIFVPR